jgi:hypothetical protein
MAKRYQREVIRNRKSKKNIKHNGQKKKGNQPGADPGVGRTRRPPPPKIAKNMIFWRKIVFFSHEIPQIFSRLPPLGAIFLRVPPPLT